MATRVGLLVLSVVLALGCFHTDAQAQGPSMAPSIALGPTSTVLPPAAPPPSTETTPLAPGPAAANDCMTTLMDNLYACLTYVEAGSNMTRPEKGCCQGLAAVVNTQPICLCSLVASNDVYGIQIDRTKSLMLPTVCRVQTPPVSLCSVIAGGSPASSPAGSPSAAAPLGPTLPAEAASPAASPPPGSSADPNIRSSALALLAGLSFAAVAMF